MNENNSRIHFTSFEWGVINLFEKINDRFIIPKFDNWKNGIAEDKFLRFNLLSGFLNIYYLLNEDVAFENECKKAIKTKFEQNNFNIDSLHISYLNGNIEKENERYVPLLKELIDNHGFLLFNSYFFNVVISNGEKSLKPSILGYNFGKTDSDILEKCFQYFNQNSLPYRLYNFQQFALTNSNQILPFKGGITPHYVFLSTLPGHIETAAHRDNNFLENFSMLFKREDYLQGHLSSLIHTIKTSNSFSDSNEPIGAYMLTSIIPNAYDDKDKNTIHNIITDFDERGNLSDTHFEMIYDFESIWTNIFFPDSDFKNEIELAKKIRKNLKELLSTQDSIIYLKGVFNNDNPNFNICQFVVIDFGKLHTMTNNIFPNGPWLERSLVCNVDNFNIKKREIPIDLKRLSEYNRLLTKIFKKENYNEIEIENYTFFKQFIDLLIPEISKNYGSLNDCIHNIELDEEYYLSIVSAPSSKSIERYSPGIINNLKKAIIDCINADFNLPDGDNHVFLEVQSKWNVFQDKRNIKDTNIEFNQIESKILFEEIKNLIKENQDIRAVFLFKNKKLFIPEIGNELLKQNHFVESYTDYASYWLFEKINHHFYDVHLDANSFDSQNFSSSITHYYVYPQKVNGNSISVYLSTDSDKNSQFIKTLVFYGIEVNSWNPVPTNSFKKLQEPYIVIHLKDDEKYYSSFNDFYKDYINFKLEDAKALECINRIFGDKIRTIEIEKKSDFLEYSIVLYGDISSTEYKNKWVQVDSIMPELTIINNQSVLDAINLGQVNSGIVDLLAESKMKFEYEYCKSYSGLDCVNNSEYEHLENNRIRLISEDLKYAIKRIWSIKTEEKANLLPQLSHAIGTEISALANILALYIEEHNLSNRKIDTNIKDLYFEIKDAKINTQELNSMPQIALMYEKLTEDQKIFITRLIEYFPDFNIKGINELLDVCKIYSNTYTFSNFLENFIPKLKHLRDKNRALLRIDEKESHIQFSNDGVFDLESTFYSSLLFALWHFFGNTIFRDRDNWSKFKPTFSEDSYKIAFSNYWGKKDSSYFENEKSIWKKNNIIIRRDDNIKEQFYNWYNDYNRLETSIFIFKCEITNNIKFNGETGALIIDMMFQEIILNALKYSIKHEGKVVLEVSIRGNNNGIDYFEFKNQTCNRFLRKDGKGKPFVNKVLENILDLKPYSNNASFIDHSQEGYYITKGIKK